MSPEEAGEIIRRLNIALRENGLDWVVQQVAAIVERGVEERKRVALESFARGKSSKKTGPKSEAITTRPFSEEEELRLLLLAIRSAVIDTHQIEESALAGLKTERIAFRPDVNEEFKDKGYSGMNVQGGERFDSSQEDLSKRKRYVEQLDSILAELESVIHVD
jgi:hypothetical protein